MSTPFRDRNPVIVGAFGLLGIAVVMLLAFNAQNLPVIGGGDHYYAAFSEAGGIKEGDEVRVAGVRVGKVDSVELAGDHVRVGFRIEDGDVDLGDQTRASVKIKTLLGSMYLALQPAGDADLEAGSEIPLDRTQSAYDVVTAFNDLAGTAERIDSDQLAKALSTLTDLTRDTPDEVRRTVRGLSRISQTVASKDEELGDLLTNLDRVSGVLSKRDDDIVALMKDSDTLFRALVARRESVHDLLVSATTLSRQLSGLIDDTRADLAPTLENLDSVLTVLHKNEDNLDSSLRLMAPFYRVFASTLGTGPWFDTYIHNLPPVPGAGGGVG